MRERTFRTVLSHLKIEVAMFELELRERASRATFARKHLRLCCRSWSCCENALRVQLWPEPCERTSRTIFALQSCDFAELLHLQLATFQPELRECTSRTTLVLKTCDGSAGAVGVAHYLLYLNLAAEAHCAYYFCAKLQPEVWVCSSRATFVIKSCGPSRWNLR